jgi:hypothetical protein
VKTVSSKAISKTLNQLSSTVQVAATQTETVAKPEGVPAPATALKVFVPAGEVYTEEIKNSQNA